MQMFHNLVIDDVRRETADCVSLRFAVPAALREAYAFTPGQHLTLRATIDGEEIRRSYSICSALDDGELRVAIKRVPGGRFSSWAVDTLAPGMRLDVMTPAGQFGPPASPGTARHYVAFAAGSGITPVISIVASVLAREPQATVTLVYGNRRSDTIIFRDALEALKFRHAGRFTLLHVLSAEAGGEDLLRGRIDRAKLDALLVSRIDARRVDCFLLCGPGTMVETLRAGLLAHGVAPAAIRAELFTAPPGAGTAAVQPGATGGGFAQVTVVRDGVRRSFAAPVDGGPVLDAAEAAGIELPFGCRGGVCASCRCRILEGKVELLQNFALSEAELEAGYVLACQARPLTSTVVLDFDVT